jgi:mycothiol synthase
MNLKIRQAIVGPDDETVVDIRNRATRAEPDYQPLSLDEFRVWSAGPNADPQARFLAELDGQPVATVNAFVDKEATDRKGYIGGPNVPPEFRRQGIGRAMMQHALTSLHRRGMTSVQTQILSSNDAGLQLAASFGFKAIRWDTTMRRKLDAIPCGVGECGGLEIIRLGRSQEDVRLIHDLYNETFSEHFNFRPDTIEEDAYWLEHANDRGSTMDCFVARTGDVAGIIGTRVDPEEFKSSSVKNGWLFLLGVRKPARGQGIAKRLMIHGMQDLKNKGMDEAWLGVDTQNPTHAMKLYEKLGFEVLWRYVTLAGGLTQPAEPPALEP